MFGAVPCDLPDDVVRSQFGCASVIPRINYDTATSTPVGQSAPCRGCFVPASDAGYTGSTDPRTHILACRARCPTLTAELVVARCAITAPGPRTAPRSRNVDATINQDRAHDAAQGGRSTHPGRGALRNRRHQRQYPEDPRCGDPRAGLEVSELRRAEG